jgi:hypothetical protein
MLNKGAIDKRPFTKREASPIFGVGFVVATVIINFKNLIP